jgi:hypothetical protein
MTTFVFALLFLVSQERPAILNGFSGFKRQLPHEQEFAMDTSPAVRSWFGVCDRVFQSSSADEERLIRDLKRMYGLLVQLTKSGLVFDPKIEPLHLLFK